MTLDNSKIVKALGRVIDPRTGQNIIMANMLKDLKSEGNNISFSLEVGALDAKSKSNVHLSCIQEIHKDYPSAEVNVHMLSGNPPPGQQNDILPQVKNIIAVASGKGGVGKSTVSVNLALALKAQGKKVGIIDADLYGPSIPGMLGLKNERAKVQKVYEKLRIVPLDGYGMPVLSIGFVIEPEQAVVLRGPRLGAIIKQFISDAIWPELDYLVIDLPPGTGDIQLTLVQTVPLTGVVLVTTPQTVAVDDAVKAMNMFLLPNVNVPILGVVENMSWFTPKELPENKYFIFGEGGGKYLSKKSESMLLGQVPLVKGIREGGDDGKPAFLQNDSLTHDIFEKIAQKTIKQVDIRNEMLPKTRKVDITS